MKPNRLVHLSENELRELRERWVSQAMPHLPYDHRVLIAYTATQNPGMDPWDIQAEIIVGGGPEIPEAVITAFLDSVPS